MKNFPPLAAALFLLGIPSLFAQTPTGGADISCSVPQAAKVSLNIVDNKG